MNPPATKTHWSNASDELASHLSPPPRVLIALDFDGTLAPIVASPELAALPGETLELLRQLSVAPGVTLAIVTGRAMSDIVPRVRLPGIVYSANHGLECKGLGLDGERSEATKFKPRLAAIAGEIARSLHGIQDALLEFKGLTVSLHLRNVPAGKQEAAADHVRRIVEKETGFRIQYGNMVVEVVPDIPLHKGTALLHILKRLGLPQSAALYAGDDTTDENAFLALPNAITIRVGPEQPTAARWMARDAADVRDLLHRVLKLRSSQ